MNIVKGVAELIRRSSGSQAGEGGHYWGHADKHSAPSVKFRFSDTGEEAVLSTLWQRYQNAIDKMEKRKLLHAFLLHFIQTYKNWEPAIVDQSRTDQISSEDTVVGCSYGHPSDVTLIIIQEIARITTLVTELNNNGAQLNPDLSEASMSLNFSTEALDVLNCMTIITRSMHNCKVFSYYGGVQKVTALLKAAVVQLKTLTVTVSSDEQLSDSSVEKTKVLQKILLYVVSIICSFMELHSVGYAKLQNEDVGKYFFSRDDFHEVTSSTGNDAASEARLRWRQKSVVLVMEAGGVNWLVGKSFCGSSED